MTKSCYSEPFIIYEDNEQKIWVEIVGRDQIRVGRYSSVLIRYGNSGGNNIYDQIIWVSFPNSTIVHFSDIYPIYNREAPSQFIPMDKKYMEF